MNVLWLAVADARGHLMRAHLCRQALAPHGVTVDIVTTSADGAQFIAAMGSPASVDFDDWHVAFDQTQGLRRAATHRRAVRYVVDPRRMLTDLRALRRTNYDLFVNDFHPLLLFDRALGGATPVAHVHGANLWRSVSAPFDGTRFAAFDRAVGPLVRRLRDCGDAVITHAPAASMCVVESDQHYIVPPIVPTPRRSRDDVRTELGVPARTPLICAYLNPYFRDPRLAEQIEEVCRSVGASLYAVGEGYAERPGWRSYDPDWVDKVAAADCLIAAPGMGSVGLHRTLGVPLLMLLTDQPEQRANATTVCGPAAESVEFSPTGTLPISSLQRLLQCDRPPTSTSPTTLWTRALLQVLANVA